MNILSACKYTVGKQIQVGYQKLHRWLFQVRIDRRSLGLILLWIGLSFYINEKVVT